MPLDGSGNYTRDHTWASDAAAGIKIKADIHDTHDQDMANCLSLTLYKDGRNSPTANINWNAKQITNMLNPTNPQDAATKNYVDGVRNFSSAIVITGSTPESVLKFTGSTGPFGLAFTTVDAAFGANSINFVWNSKADFSGTDVMVLGQDNGNLTLTQKDDTANAGPVLTLARDSVSPAAVDHIGNIVFRARDNANNYMDYANIDAQITDTVTASLDATLLFNIRTAGAMQQVLFLSGTTSVLACATINLHSPASTVDNRTPILQFMDKGTAQRAYLQYSVTNNRFEVYSASDHMLVGCAAPKFIYLTSSNINSTGVYFDVGTVGVPMNVRMDKAGDGQYMANATALSIRTHGSTAYGILIHSQVHAAFSCVWYQAGSQSGSISHASGNATAYNTSSDIRLKDNIQPASDARALVDALQVVEYTSALPERYEAPETVDEVDPGPDIWMGIPAQQAYTVYPHAVRPPAYEMEGVNKDAKPGEPDFMPWQIDYSKFVPMLLANVQDLNKRNDALEARLATLETA